MNEENKDLYARVSVFTKNLSLDSVNIVLKGPEFEEVESYCIIRGTDLSGKLFFYAIKADELYAVESVEVEVENGVVVS